MSSKLMKMKFMATAADQETEKAAAEEESRKISDSHWRLNFRDIANASAPPKLQVDASYTSFANLSSGRRSFGKQKEALSEEVETKQVHSDDEEAPEDMFARRQAEKEADKASLRAMQGMTSLSGASGAKRKENGNKGHNASSAKKRQRG